MKVWKNFGSEHSMNLVLLGSFNSAESAKDAYELLERCREEAQDTDLFTVTGWDEPISKRFSDAQREFLKEFELFELGALELEQFAYDVSVILKDDKIRVWTDEVDVSAYIKVLLKYGAKIEVFSAHDHPEQPDE